MMLAVLGLASQGLNMPTAARLGSRMLMRSASRVTGINMVDLEEAGEFGTTDFTMTFKCAHRRLPDHTHSQSQPARLLASS